MSINNPMILSMPRRWEKYRRYALQEKRAFVKRLSSQDGFRILADLYSFALTSHRKHPPQLHIHKLKNLIHVHRMFSKIKP